MGLYRWQGKRGVWGGEFQRASTHGKIRGWEKNRGRSVYMCGREGWGKGISPHLQIKAITLLPVGLDQV